jgi:hypothetical protein
MKPNMVIEPQLVDNAAEFSNEFYSRFTLRPMHYPLQLNRSISKNYLFPTFYGDVTCAMAIHHCSYDKVKILLKEKLHVDVEPVKMTRGRTVIAFSCYEYKKVMGVKPYNEIAVAIPVMVNSRFNPPVLPMTGRLNHFGYYIMSMPVTSQENTLRGHNIWGLPKVTEEIDIQVKGGKCITKVFGADGKPYLTISVPVDGKKKAFDETGFLYSKLNGTILRSRTNFKSVFSINKYPATLLRRNVVPPVPCLEIGNGPEGSIYRSLDIEPTPLQHRYTEHMSACFDLSETDNPEWLNALNEK